MLVLGRIKYVLRMVSIHLLLGMVIFLPLLTYFCLLPFMFPITLNFLSITRLTKSLNCSVTFFSFLLFVSRLGDEDDYWHGDGLYLLDSKPSIASRAIKGNITPSTSDELLQ